MAENKTKKGKFNAPWKEDDEPSFDKATGSKMKFKKEFEEFNFSW